jgi:hypothetical protein
MKGERKYSYYSSLTSALDGSERSVSGSGHALRWGKNPCTHGIGGWIGHRAGLNTEAKGKILCLCWGSNPSHPVCSQTLYSLSYAQVPTVISEWPILSLFSLRKACIYYLQKCSIHKSYII